MIRTHKTEYFPTHEQKQFIEQCFGIRRFCFNYVLSSLKKKYGNLKENIKAIKLKEVKSFNVVLRRDFHHFTSLVPSQIVDTALEDLSYSLDSLRCNRGRNRTGEDVKLRKKKFSNSCRIQRKDKNTFKCEENSKYLKLVRIGYLKLAECLRYGFEDNIKTVTIKKQAGRYFISITMEILEELPSKPKTQKHIAFDYGIKTFLTGYDGTDFYEIDFDRENMGRFDKNIARKQKALANKKQYSKSWLAAKTKLEQSYLDRVSYQNDFLYKLTNELSSAYDSITLEDLNMSFMIRNRHLAKKASENMYYRFRVFVHNKFSPSGKKVYLSKRTFPSTQLCSNCGNVKEAEDKLKLNERVYKCSLCNFSMNRDENAAINLFNNRDLSVFEV